MALILKILKVKEACECENILLSIAFCFLNKAGYKELKN